MSRSALDNKIATMIVDQSDLSLELGSGDEGTVYNYRNQYAFKRFKLFRDMEYYYRARLELKFKKIEELSKLTDEQMVFPLGIFGYSESDMEGYYMRIVASNDDFFSLYNMPLDKQIEMLIKGDEVIHRAHDMGLVIGDIKENNIMIEDGKPILIDLDNAAYGDYQYDLLPERSFCYYYVHGKEGPIRDNDIMLYTLMCLKMIFKDREFDYRQCREILWDLVDHLPVSNEIKDDIWVLLSDSLNKPYVSPVLAKIRKYIL